MREKKQVLKTVREENVRDFSKVRCPICGGEINNQWFQTIVRDDGDKQYARFVCECWSGDLDNITPEHIFVLDYLIDGEVTYPLEESIKSEVYTIKEESE